MIGLHEIFRVGNMFLWGLSQQKIYKQVFQPG